MMARLVKLCCFSRIALALSAVSCALYMPMDVRAEWISEVAASRRTLSS
eukprot:CAMPEP_0183365322 /NCGR_PEP_ID=MMETSP0164_2-20130417/84275_1 /TAXON_ID=221442 /ORGANISM="Coccolithus pelagicus ssp braarudi, Strain PLY182g" /LENGTH=48 /DNA_ID= /DNA_START= /DNA_END= /DNA_ORIENTATION=